MALVALVLLPGASLKGGEAPPKPSVALRSTGVAAEVDSYWGLASWVDMYDKAPWDNPERAVRRLAERGVQTLFLETSNYRIKQAIYRKQSASRMLDAAHSRGLKVVAWYVPGFGNLKRDWLRTKKAVNFTSAAGQRFDGFAMDIEATVVRNIATRNRRMLRLSKRLRRFVGKEYALGAIIPDPVTQRYWPNFPYQEIHARYDVFLPMAYWTYRTGGEKCVRRYTRDALRIIRAQTGDSDVPIHVIGGIANRAPVPEVRAFRRAAITHRAVGASLYDYPITSARQWKVMLPLAKLAP